MPEQVELEGLVPEADLAHTGEDSHKPRGRDETESVDHANQQGDAAGQRKAVMTNEPWAEASADDETMIINMGPQHPSTHGVLRLILELDAETVLSVKPVIGYLHTGMEKTAETLSFVQGATNVTRMDYLAPMSNELCWSLTVEKLLGIEVPPRATAIRVLMAELNRISSHLVSLATQGMDLGAISMMIYGFREREEVLAFFEKCSGLRMNNDYIRPGGVAADLPPDWESDVGRIVETFPAHIDEYEELLTDNPIWRERTVGVGAVSIEQCYALGLTGPILRAAGKAWDLRVDDPYCGYETYDFDVVTGNNGDVFDRYKVRVGEIRESLKIVRQVLDGMPDGDYRSQDKKVTPPPRIRIDESMEALIHHFKIFTEGYKVPAGEVYCAIESPRGEIANYLVSNGSSKPWRLHVRAPSFANLQGLATMMEGGLLADAVAVIASTDPVMGDVDR